MQIEVRNLKKDFGQFAAVQNVSFDIEPGKLIGLLGPSGGGKTTILRMLAGLEKPTSGEILFHGKNVNHLPPQERGIGFVFQNYALFKHMNVFDNIAFGLTVQKKTKREIQERVYEMIELIGLKGLAERYPHQLSGGQRQRVAFARALAPSPELLLLDEPFAAIDAKVRKELRTWLREMISRVGVTSIFVTHDQEEAVEVADEIMIINSGRLEQKGTPWQVYKEPQTPFVASFLGESNILPDTASITGFEAATFRLRDKSRAKTANILIRPESIEVGREHEISNPAAASIGLVKSVQFRGTLWQVEVEVGHHRLLAHRTLEKETLKPGDEVAVLIHSLHLFHEDESLFLENEIKRASSAAI
ncbi:sulfate/molybdate ABC transporter ATP-binding protein [Tumebacillus permanentifrigoris]|uniref:Carnitine transport ATP-binding protein OpuCA n=1 Tax=Tumebacillus permanentifrigoris TaxID=378543 RepID=A0A316D6T8_9BACL|nr:ABC transporter ATP-binding protein [Tumebacillus permanentifrigoris]PWK10304.1 sulfate transport system ATP-binding protein [Tumebacillus permanentifrigoris]